MTLEEIQTELDALAAAMTDRGVVRPKAEFDIIAGESQRIMLNCAPGEGLLINGDNYYIFIRADTPAEMFAKAREHIAALPDLDEVERREFLSKVSDAAEHGRKIGLDHDTYIAPLRGVAQAVSENLLTHDKAAE